MWGSVLDIIVTAVNAAFGWFDQVLNSLPGAWDTIFTLIVILVLSRYLLGPLLGSAFRLSSGSSDKSKKNNSGNDGD